MHIEKLKPFVEAFPQDFLRGLYDSEGSPKVSIVNWKKWRWLSLNIGVTNTNLDLLLYTRDLLKRRFDIKSSIKHSHRKGTSFIKDGKKNYRTKDAYELVIYNLSGIKLFSSIIGFSINRKQEKLLDSINIFENYKTGSERVEAWLKLYRKQTYIWIKRGNIKSGA